MNTRYTNLKQGQLEILLGNCAPTYSSAGDVFVYFSHGRRGWEDLPVLLNTQLQKYWPDALKYFRSPLFVRQKTDLGRFIRWAENHVRKGNVAVNVHRGESWVNRFGRVPKFLEAELEDCGPWPVHANWKLPALLDDYIVYGYYPLNQAITGHGLLNRQIGMGFPPQQHICILPKGPSAHQARANKHWPIVTG